jgi:predicted nucleic acid-binding protein
MIVVDSSMLYALFDPTDGHHDRARSFIAANPPALVTNVPVLSEVAYLLDYSVRDQCAFLKWASEVITIDTETAADLPRILEIMGKYADLPADFADASLLALCERAGIHRIATLDRDFAVYRLRNRKRLVNVFDAG